VIMPIDRVSGKAGSFRLVTVGAMVDELVEKTYHTVYHKALQRKTHKTPVNIIINSIERVGTFDG